jgi:hypothetical protein
MATLAGDSGSPVIGPVVSPVMNPLIQRVCVWTGAFGFALMALGFIVGSQFPFPSPNHDAAYFGAFYLEHTNGIRLMAVFVTTGGALTAALAAVIGVHIKQIQGAAALAYLEIGMGCASALAIGIPGFFWQTAAFRPERDPVVTQSWHDAGWLCFVATVFLAILQFSATGLAVLTDRGETPVFPRWFGYLSFWASAGLVPSVLCLWFKTGPFAWNGALTLYLAFVVAGPWIISAVVLTLRKARVATRTG